MKENSTVQNLPIVLGIFFVGVLFSALVAIPIVYFAAYA